MTTTGFATSAARRLRSNALIGKLGPSTDLSGNPTNRELTTPVERWPVYFTHET
jgi:hypothetical protein